MAKYFVKQRLEEEGDGTDGTDGTNGNWRQTWRVV
jgi:hypothetical protein